MKYLNKPLAFSILITKRYQSGKMIPITMMHLSEFIIP